VSSLRRLLLTILVALLITAALLALTKNNSQKNAASQGIITVTDTHQDAEPTNSSTKDVSQEPVFQKPGGNLNSQLARAENSPLDINNIQAAWAAASGSEALEKLKNSDLSDSQVIAFLMLARASCKIALHYSDPANQPDVNRLSDNARANSQFVDHYCGRDAKLIQRIDLALSSAREKMLQQPALANGEITRQAGPEQDSDLDKLIAASHKSSAAADALINELLAARSPDAARILAQNLSSATENQGVLASWNQYLPANAQRIERMEAFTIAGELLACPRLAGCGPGAVLSMYQCAVGGPGRCQPGEDLLSYRRRTTSPMLYQAAEQIAAAMQARRYR
jgi:hypothetical protein